MKKNFLFLALSALIIPAFIACNKDDKGEEETTFEAPKYQQEAQRITFEKGDFKSLELTESGTYILERVITKTLNITYDLGTYTLKGNVYTLNGFGTVELEKTGSDVKATFKENGKDATTAEGKAANKSTGNSNLYRTWIVENVRFIVSGGTLGDAGIVYTSKVGEGCDLEKIAAEVNKKVTIDVSEYVGYSIKDIIFTASGTFLIEFTGEDPYIGQYNLSSNKVNYEFTVGGSDLFNTKGTGAITFKNGRCVLTLNGKFSVEGTEYTYSVEFRLLPNA